jgi:hypothetical protein
MKGVIAILTAGVLLATGASGLVSAEEKTIATQKTKDVVVTLKSESGQWKQGRNAFVLEFSSARDGKPVDEGKATLSTNMVMTGMAPMIAGATLTPDKIPGRYLGTITFPDSGTRQVTVSWDGPAGKGSTKFSVSVR